MGTDQRVYLDYAATTPVDERVLNAMLPFFRENFGNPSSGHVFGQRAEAALEEARQTVADLLHARAEEIIFTACGTESDNLALRGMALAQHKKSGARHLLVSPVEHHAVSHTLKQLADEFDFELEYLPVDQYGMVHPVEVEGSIRPDTALVSVIYANNEIGTINPIAEIGEVCRRRKVAFHTDAVQAAAHLPMDVHRDGVDALAIGAHKFYGPKGVGALFLRRGTAAFATQTGGKQEHGMRAGTQNVPYIVGLAEALKIAQGNVTEHAAQLTGLRDTLIEGVLTQIPRARLTGHPQKRLPNHASFVFEGVDGNQLLMMLDAAGFAVSSGSACKVGTPEPSEVLLALGLPRGWVLGSLRVTLGRETTREEIDAFLAVLPDVVNKIHKLS